MVEDQNNGQKMPMPAAVKKMVKVPVVKRVKVPVAGPAAPAPSAPKIIQPEQTDSEPPLPPEEEDVPAPVKIPAPQPVPPAAKAPAQPAQPQPAQPQPAPAAPAAKPEVIQPVHSENEPPLPKEENKQPPAPAAKGSSRMRRREAIQSGDAAAKKKAKTMEEAKQKAASIGKNKWVRLVAAVMILGGIIGGIYHYLPALAEKKLPEILAANGLKLKTFKVKELTISSMELTGITDSTGTMSVSSMKADYSLKDLLMNSKLKSVTVNGLSLTGVRNDEGVSFGALGGLMSSTVRVKKGLEIDLPKMTVSNSKFILKREREKELLDENGDPIDETMIVNFSATGKLQKSVLEMTFLTDYESPQMRVKTSTKLTKSAADVEIKTEITEGDVLKKAEQPADDFNAPEPQVIGSVKGTTEFSVKGGVLTKGVGNLALTSSSQTLTLNGEIVPQAEGFDLSLKLNRSFEDKKDAVGKFTGDLDIEAKKLQMNGTFQSFTGRLPLTLASASLSNGSMLFRQLKVSTDLHMDCKEGKCTFQLMAPMPVSFGSAIVNGKFRQFKFFQPVALRINPDPKEPFLETDGGLLSFSLPMSGFTAQTVIADQLSNHQIGLAMNASKMHLKTNVFSTGFTGDYVFGQSYYTDKDVKASGVQGALSFDGNTLPSGRIRVAEIELKKEGLLPNFSGDFVLKPMGTDEYGVKSMLQIQNGLVTVSADGAYSLPAHRWNLYVNIPKVILSETDLPLESVLPFMTSVLSPKTTGAFAMKGRIVAEQGKIMGPVSLLLDNVSTQWQGMDIQGASGVLTLTSLLPLETPENQMLFAGRFNPGLPFNNALFNFKVVAERGVQVSNARMRFADGQFKTIKSFFYPYDGAPSAILMEGSGIDLSTFTRLLKTASLQADGTLNSEWKMSFGENGLQIDQAKLLSKLPGTIHFDPSVKVKKSMDPGVVKFLSEVIVKQLGITIQGPLNGVLTFKTKITGHSPLEQSDSTVKFEFTNSFGNMLKEDTSSIDLPSDVMLSIQNYIK